MKKTIFASVIIAALFGVIAAGEQLSSAKALVTDNVMFIPVAYNQGQWFQANEIQFAPCEPPSKPNLGNEFDPVIRAYDAQGEEIYEQGMRNPRLILIEDPKEPAALLSQIRFELRLPYVRGISRIEFWEFPREQKEPSMVLEVPRDPQIPEKADCQVPEFVPDALRGQQ
ncbi:MAG: hypothetical protein MI867_02315 [Pseudomonadales bacterium]|nr:hypothetical protein [Pseudomonadales bacterium]